MSGHELFDDLVAAYALDALDPQERLDFEAHLATCADCQRTLADLRRVSASIGLSSDPIDPPASLKARAMAMATGRPELTVPEVPKVPKVPKVPSVPVASLWLALAASLLCVAGLSVYAWTLRSELAASRQLVSDMSNRVETLRAQVASARVDSARLLNTISVLRSADLLRVDLRGQGVAPEAIGRAFVSPVSGLVFNAERLPRLGANRTYQLWVVPPGADPVSAGTFNPDAAGNTILAMPLPGGVRLVAAVAVTEEPAGGSVKATTAPLLLGAVRN